MIAYNYNIDFISEPKLNDSIENPLLETITIIQDEESIDYSNLKYHSQYEVKGNNRQIKYSAEYEFSECLNKNCIWGLEIQNIVTFVWGIDSHVIKYKKEEQFTPEQLRLWLLYLLLPIKFTLEKKYDILHVGAVEVDGHCIVFAAESFGGKSTLTNCFIEDGYKMFCDDSLAVYKQDDTFYAVSSYPYHRPYRKAEDLGYYHKNIATEPKKIKAIYLLKKTKPDANITINELKGINKFKTFHFQSAINFEFLKTYRLKVQSEMANQIPVYEIFIPWDIGRLDEVKSAILT